MLIKYDETISKMIETKFKISQGQKSFLRIYHILYSAITNIKVNVSIYEGVTTTEYDVIM